MKKKILSTISIFVTCIASLTPLGCTTQKYQVDYCGQKILFNGAKDSYAAGTEVTLYYDFIATDTDYSFLLDGEPLPVTYDEKKGYVIRFTMPEHNITLKVVSRNSMLPPTTISNVVLLDFYQKVFTAEVPETCQITLKSTELESQIVMEVYKDNIFKEYVFPSYVFDDCMEIINKYNMQEWNQLEEFTCLDGATISCRFQNEDKTYTYVSSDKMPENGETIFNEIYQALLSYIQTQ